jgi:thioredoxin 1
MKSLLSGNWTGLLFVLVIVVGAGLVYSDFAPIRRFLGPSQSAGSAGDRDGATRTTPSHVPNGIVHANDRDFHQVVLRSDVPVLVDFYADWCGPCRALGPVLEQVASETTGAKIVKVNVDESRHISGQYGVSAIPCLLVFKNGQVVDRHVGSANKQQIRALLDV